MEKLTVVFKRTILSLIFIIYSGSVFADAIKMKLPAVKVNDNVEVIDLGQYKIHTFYGVSNSHVIETPTSLTLVDLQFLDKHAVALRDYIDTLNKPLSRAVLSHNHPDHWFGYRYFNVVPLTTPGVKDDLDNRGEEFIQIMKPRMKDAMPDKVVTVDTSLKLGEHNWDGLRVIVEEYREHESHHSVVLKLPDYGVIVGQDLFYKDSHLVASNLDRNKNWVALLEGFIENEAKTYHTFLTGHGPNATAAVLSESIVYLEVLDGIIRSGVTKDEAKAKLLERFPNKRKETQGFINITLRNLYAKNHK